MLEAAKKQALEFAERLNTILKDYDKRRSFELGEHKGELYHVGKIQKQGNTFFLSFIIYNRTKNTYTHLRNVYEVNTKGEVDIIRYYEYCENAKVAICLASNDIPGAKRHSTFKDAQRCIRHHNDIWFFQVLEDTDILIGYDCKRCKFASAGSFKESKTIAKNQKYKDTIFSSITRNNNGELSIFVDMMMYDKKTKAFVDFISEEFDKIEDYERFVKNGVCVIKKDD